MRLKIRHAKGGNERFAYLGEEAARNLWKHIRTQGAESGALFRDGKGQRLNYDQLRRIIQKRARLAGIKKAPELHSFRRAFGIGLYRDGVDLYTVSRLLGHKSIEPTKRYLKFVDDDLVRAHAKHSLGDKISMREVDF